MNTYQRLDPIDRGEAVAMLDSGDTAAAWFGGVAAAATTDARTRQMVTRLTIISRWMCEYLLSSGFRREDGRIDRKRR